MNWVQTFSGRKVDLEYPKPEDIAIEDIAHALSRICRYGGHCKDFYSVAEHSLLVEKVIQDEICDCKPVNMAGLLHDAAEAYLGDMISPLKKIVTRELYLEGRWLDAISEKFALEVKLNPMNRRVHTADAFMMKVEVYSVLPSVHSDWGFPLKRPEFPSYYQPKCLPPAEAEKAFLARFRELVTVL
jgi:hypothetical protein